MNFQNDAAASNFARDIFDNMYKDICDLVRLKEVPDIRVRDDISVIGPRVYNFPNELSTSHRMLMYA